MVIKICEWCKKEFEAKHGNEKYCKKHKSEAKKEATNKRRRNYYIRNKNKKESTVIGTTTLGKHPQIPLDSTYLGIDIPLTDFSREYQIVHRELSVTTNSNRGRQRNNIWVDYDGRYGQVEYGSPIPPQNTHTIQFNDNFNLSVSYWMETTQKCPECEDTEHLRDVSRAEIACSCGLTLAGPMHRSVKYPDENYPDIPIAKFSHEHKSQKLKKEMESLIV